MCFLRYSCRIAALPADRNNCPRTVISRAVPAVRSDAIALKLSPSPGMQCAGEYVMASPVAGKTAARDACCVRCSPSSKPTRLMEAVWHSSSCRPWPQAVESSRFAGRAESANAQAVQDEKPHGPPHNVPRPAKARRVQDMRDPSHVNMWGRRAPRLLGTPLTRVTDGRT